MVHDPRRGDKQIEKAGSLFFFIVAVLVMALSAALELLQNVPPLQIGSTSLLLLLLLAVILLVYRLRGILH